MLMVCHAEDKTKRLLLTDPVVMQNEISSLKQMVHNLTAQLELQSKQGKH